MTDHVFPQPFPDFLKSVGSAKYDEMRSLPGSEVESASALEEMRAYVLDLYSDVGVDTSFVEDNGQVIDCIPDEQHPAVRRSSDDVTATPPDAPREPESYETTQPDFTSGSTSDVSGALPQLRHQASAEARYPAGTLPMYRTTLQQLARFKNLAAFSVKDDRFDGGVAVRTASAFPKHYATGEQDVDCLGGSSNVNVWRPFVTPSFQATFSQQWHVAGHDGTLLQTVECGWHIDSARYGDAEPHLFVYTTRQNYDPGHSFFNEDGFVYKRIPSINTVLPGTRLLTSQTDGTQIEYQMGFYLTAGAWWFYFNGIPQGCYPLAWFNNGPLTQGGKRIKFGGEVGTGFSLWPPMGSGFHASAGFGKAAYQRDALVYPAAGGAASANLLEAGSVSGPCYTIDITNNSGSQWGSYLFFGGPGGASC